MAKRLLSLFIALCMILNMIPISVMAKESIGTSEEIIAFNPLSETVITVTPGTSLEDLKLPKTLTATVKTNNNSEGNIQDSENNDHFTEVSTNEGVGIEFNNITEISMDIPVTWTSEPEYDMNTQGEYVFTPIIDGYTVNTELPVIIVNVKASVMLQMSTTVNEYDIWVGGIQVTDANKDHITGDGISGDISYDPDTKTLTLNNATITGAYDKYYDTINIYSDDRN